MQEPIRKVIVSHDRRAWGLGDLVAQTAVYRGVKERYGDHLLVHGLAREGLAHANPFVDGLVDDDIELTQRSLDSTILTFRRHSEWPAEEYAAMMAMGLPRMFCFMLGVDFHEWPRVWLSDDVLELADKWLGGDTRIRIALSIDGPGTDPRKAWPVDRWRWVVGNLANDDYLFVYLGNSIVFDCGEWVLNLTNCVTAYIAAAILSRCSLFIGNERGTRWLAEAVGVRCVVPWGGMADIGLYTNGLTHAVQSGTERDCKHCQSYQFRKYGGRDCPHGAQCLLDVGQEDVLAAIKEELRKIERTG